jgi:hypothetical protein
MVNYLCCNPSSSIETIVDNIEKIEQENNVEVYFENKYRKVI